MLFFLLLIKAEDCSLHRGATAAATHGQHGSCLHILKHRRVGFTFPAPVATEKCWNQCFCAARNHSNGRFNRVIMRCHAHDVPAITRNCYFQFIVTPNIAR